MSYTINGIGTHIYGRDRELTREDQCEQCGRYSVLSSYDATNYFVVIFIPIIPLGKLRILDHCSSCQRWKQLPLKKWESAKEDAVRSSLNAMRENPSDPDAVKTALVTATQFQDEGMLLQFKQIADNFRADSEVQGLLGATLSYFGRNQEAVGAYEAAVAANHEDESLKEQLALEYSLTGQPEKAEPHLAHIWSADKQDKIAYAIELVRGYQAKGDHQTAIAKLDKVAELHPSIAEDREFKRIVKEAKKHEKKGTAVPQLSKTNTRYKEKSSSSSVAKWIFPAILGFGVLAFLVASFLAANNREVVLVNGLDKAYTATINGEEHELRPRRVERIKVSEGNVTVSAEINGIDVPEEVCKVKTPFFARLGSKQLFVINPDRTAIIAQEEVIYSKRNNNRQPDYARFTGDLFYEFDGIDYQFEAPPRQLELSSSGSTAVRDYVHLADVNNLPEIEAVTELSLVLEPDEFLDYLKRKIEYGSQSQILLGVYADRADPEDVMAILKPKLDEFPVNLEVHRTYQQMIESSQPDHDLEKDYAARLAKNPQNGNLIYLLSRVTPEKAKRMTLLKRATATNPPSAYAFSALAFEAVSQGQPRRGIQPSQKALQLEPDNISFKRTRAQVLKACGQYEAALKLNHEMFTNRSTLGEIQQLGVDIPILVAAGQSRKAKQQIEGLLGEFRSQNAPPQFIDSMKIGLLGNLAYSQGNLTELRQLSRTVGADEVPIHFNIALSQIEQASQRMLEVENQNDSKNTQLDLAIYIAAKMASKDTIAEKHLARAIEQLSQGDKDEKMLATALGTGGVSNPEELSDIAAWPEEKRVYLAALALRFPDDFDAYSTLAKKLNVDRESPYLLIKQLRLP